MAKKINSDIKRIARVRLVRYAFNDLFNELLYYPEYQCEQKMIE